MALLSSHKAARSEIPSNSRLSMRGAAERSVVRISSKKENSKPESNWSNAPELVISRAKHQNRRSDPKLSVLLIDILIAEMKLMALCPLVCL